MKLRLGKLSSGRQKGVDSRIVRDLIVLARDRAITTAYVLSGDEDIREGVAEAQDCGVLVVLLGMTPQSGQHNQARSLVQEADDRVVLTRDQISQWIMLRADTVGPGNHCSHDADLVTRPGASGQAIRRSLGEIKS